MPVKKPSSIPSRTKGLSLSSVLGYSLPKLHEGKSWYIDFFSRDPLSDRLKRKKYMVPAAPSVRERRRLAQELIFSLTASLQDGWSPWTGATKAAHTVPWSRICQDYERYILRMAEKDAIRLSTQQNYFSYFHSLCTFIEKANVAFVYVHQLTRPLICEWLNSLILMNDISARTRNSYLGWVNTFGTWLVEQGALESNPAEGIRKMKESEKFREQFSPAQLHTLRTYLYKHDRHFLLACLFEYYTFIRPEELCSVTIGDISVTDMRIVLRGENTKNRKDAAVGLNEEIVKLMIDIGTFSAPSHFYLFGTRDFFPSERRQSGRIFRERFQKLRKELGWPAQYQFYSLKDTGIRDLANAEGIVIARDQARHSDITTTNKYLKGNATAVHEETKHFKGGL